MAIESNTHHFAELATEIVFFAQSYFLSMQLLQLGAQKADLISISSLLCC